MNLIGKALRKDVLFHFELTAAFMCLNLMVHKVSNVFKKFLGMHFICYISIKHSHKTKFFASLFKDAN